MNDVESNNNNNRRKRTRLHLVPPDDTDMSAVADEDTLSSMSSDDDISHLEQHQHFQQQEHPSTPPPQSFICPLTMEIMFDPVLDNEGNSFERTALLDWLKDSHVSPISGQPLFESRLIPNTALRQIIHDVMGSEWVNGKTEEQARRQAAVENHDNTKASKIPTTISIQSSLSSMSPPSSAGINISASTRARINCFLQTTEKVLGIPNLSLNEDGCCAFQQEGVTIVLDVPENIGVFCFYTRDLLPEDYYLNSKASVESVYRTALEMNFLQGMSPSSKTGYCGEYLRCLTMVLYNLSNR